MSEPISSRAFNLCAIDLDETLLGPDHLVSDFNQRAIRAASMAGMRIVIASGRMHESTLKFVRQMDLEGPVVSYNGALVKVEPGGEELLHHKVPAPAAQEVMEYCEREGLQLNFYHNGLIYSRADTDWLQLYTGRTGSPYTIEPDLMHAMHGIEPTKLLIVNTEAYTNTLLTHFKERFEGELYVTKTTAEYLEFMPVAANKGSALQTVSDHFGIPREQCIAIGDSYNDIPMVEWAGLGVAVSNARDAVKAAADRIIGANTDDAVGHLLLEVCGLDPRAVSDQE
jgi:Cof subfamily protein (haloacid dehalogenase superfamily)